MSYCCVFCFQAEDGIRDLVRSRGLGDVYKRQEGAVVDRAGTGVRPSVEGVEVVEQVHRRDADVTLSLIHI